MAIIVQFLVWWAIIYFIMFAWNKLQSAVSKSDPGLIPEVTKEKTAKKRRIIAAIIAAVLTIVNEFILVMPK